MSLSHKEKHDRWVSMIGGALMAVMCAAILGIVLVSFQLLRPHFIELDENFGSQAGIGTPALVSSPLHKTPIRNKPTSSSLISTLPVLEKEVAATPRT